MTKFYEYEGQKFEVSDIKDCTMKVSIDGLTATIDVDERTGQYRVNAKDGIISSIHNDEKVALNSACRRILTQLNASSKKELCSRLENLYDKL